MTEEPPANVTVSVKLMLVGHWHAPDSENAKGVALVPLAPTAASG